MRLARRFVHAFKRLVGADPIRHVIVLMFENHSFDQMLGCFKLEPGFEKLDGVDPNNLWCNKDSKQNPYLQRQSKNPVVSPDPKHELDHVAKQLEDGNSGFVLDYEKAYTDDNPDLQRIMDYFGLGNLPVLHELARHFTICDHWYSSVPGPTWTNRFFVHSGTSLGRVRMPGGLDQNPWLYLGYDQDTIYDRLDEGGRSWRIYHGDVPQSLVLSRQQTDEHSVFYEWLDQFFEDSKRPEREFPDYSFIEPRYFHIPFERPQNDDHPPHSTIPAQALLAEVYNALRANDGLWNSTLLIVVYDEHGGFFDHVIPPSADPPDDFDADYKFNQFGLRVPALLVSPWVEQRFLRTTFDHTSILKYLIKKWRLRPLGKRASAANSIREAISVIDGPRSNTPPEIKMPKVEMMAAAPVELSAPGAEEDLNDNQKALFAFSEHLESKTPAHARLSLAKAKSLSSGGLARERIRAYLEQSKGKRPNP